MRCQRRERPRVRGRRGLGFVLFVAIAGAFQPSCGDLEEGTPSPQPKAEGESAFCGAPSYGPGAGAALYVWQDCEAGTWHLRATAGGSRLAFSGAIASDLGFDDVAPYRIERGDSVDVSSPGAVVFDFDVAGAGQDGVDFAFPTGATVTLEASLPSGARLLVGAGREPAGSPLVLSEPAAVTPVPCGEPAVDPAEVAAMALWRDCASSAWHARFTAGGRTVRYRGTITSSRGPLSATPVSIEGTDRVELPDARTVAFDLSVSSAWHDRLDLSVPEGSTLRVELDPPGSEALVVGPDMTPVEPPADLVEGEGGGVAPEPPFDADALGYLDVTTYGADPGGRRVSTAALQRAIDDALGERRALFFPPGTYLVDDTLRCMEPAAEDQNTPHDEAHGCVLVGSTRGPRPVIRLVDSCPGFGDDSVPNATVRAGVVTVRPTVRAVVHFWRQQTLAEGGSTDPELEDGSRSYNHVIRNIDIDLGSGNPGAVGVRHFGAEGSAIEEVRITARDGFAGLYSFPGSGGASIDVEVVGGRHGIYAPAARGGAQVIAGLRLSGQREEPIVYTGQYPLTIVGFEIRHEGGPVVDRRSYYHDCSGHLALVDGSIDLTGAGSTPAVQNTDRSIYMRGVYVRGASTIVRNTGDGSTLAAPSASSWTLVDEYSYTDGAAFVDGMVDGLATRATIRSVSTASSVPSDLVARHVYAAHLCSFEDAAAVNVMDFGAVGDGVADDTAALRAAVAAGDTVLLPEGRYRVRGTIDLRSTTRLCGVASVLSVIEADPSWAAASLTPLLRTPDDARAAVALADLEIRTGATANRIYHLLWRSGRSSVVRNVIPSTRGPWPGSFDIPLRRTRITGHGGGRFFVYPQSTAWDCMDEGCRLMSIEGTTEPLAFYMYHHQYLKVGGGPLTEIDGAENVSFFGQKTETIIPGREADHERVFGTPWPILMSITDSRNIWIIGEEGPSQAEPGRGLFEVTDSTGVTIVNVGRRGDASSAYHDERTWFFVREVFGGRVSTIDATGLVGLFRRR